MSVKVRELIGTMIKTRIYLETKSDITNFVNICENFPFDVFLEDKNGIYRVSAKSTLGVILAKAEWEETYCVTNCTDPKWLNFLIHSLDRNKLS